MSSFSKILKIIFFSGCYPFLSVLFEVVGIGSILTPLEFYLSLFLLFTTTVFLVIPIVKNIPNKLSGLLYFGIPFFLSSFFHPLGVRHSGLSLFIVLSGYILTTQILKILKIYEKCYTSNSWLILLSYWVINIVCASVISSIGLNTLSEIASLVPIFSVGYIFGWFAPEVVYWFIGNEKYGPILAAAFYVVLFFGMAILYDIVLRDVLMLAHLEADGRYIVSLSIISILPMLLSRIIFNVQKNINAMK